MGDDSHSAVKFFVVIVVILLAVPLLVVGVVGVRTWMPLRQAGQSLEALELALGTGVDYTPAVSGEIPPGRMDLFLELRATLVTACDNYGTVEKGFEAVEAMDSTNAEAGDIAETARLLGSASLSITPFLAKFFELRNHALLEAKMGLAEYAYIYALAYHEQLLSERTRAEIFSDGKALSPEASVLLQGCLERQLEAMGPARAETARRAGVEAELHEMSSDPARLIWQDGLPPALSASLATYRDRLDLLFCGATAGLEMEQNARRAIRIALE